MNDLIWVPRRIFSEDALIRIYITAIQFANDRFCYTVWPLYITITDVNDFKLFHVAASVETSP